MSETVLSGIYEIRNNLTGDFYIGQSVCIARRWRAHKSMLNLGTHCNPHFQNAWNKYGSVAFSLRVILVCEPEELTRYEQALVNSRHPAYNICTECVDSTRGVIPGSEARAKMSASRRGKPRDPDVIARSAAHRRGRLVKPETCANISAALKRYYAIPEHLEKLSTINLGRHAGTETRAKLSAAQIHRFISPEEREKLSVAQRTRRARERRLRTVA